MEWILVSLIRLLVPLIILRFPLAGSILAVIADNLDVVILDLLGVTDFTRYNSVDKALDIYMYLIQGYTVLSWENVFAKKIGIGLLAYRLIGTVLYEFTQLRALLFVFPNVFIFYYMYCLIYKAVFKRDPFQKTIPTIGVLAVLTLLKLGQEYMLHIAQFPIYQFLKETLFPFI